MLTKFFTTNLILFIVATFICFLPSWCGANDLIVVTETWPPFRIIDKDSELQYKGIDIDLLKEISKRLKMKIKIKRYPWARCISMMKSGQGDIITGLAYTKERTQYIQYTQQPYYIVSSAFYVRSGDRNRIKNYEDLYDIIIGYSLNSAYFDRFDSDTKLIKHGAPKEIHLIKMLLNKRLDVIIGTDANAEYDIAQLKLKDKIEKAYYSPEEKTELFVGISKKSPFLSDYNKVDTIVKELVETGVIQTIANNYFSYEQNK